MPKVKGLANEVPQMIVEILNQERAVQTDKESSKSRVDNSLLANCFRLSFAARDKGELTIYFERLWSVEKKQHYSLLIRGITE